MASTPDVDAIRGPAAGACPLRQALPLLCLGLLAAGCNCDPTPHQPDGSVVTPDAAVVTVEVAPASVSVVAGAAGVAFSATVTGSSAAPGWTLEGPGSLSTATGLTVTWLPPTDVPTREQATLTATVEGRSASATLTVEPRPVSSVVLSVAGGCLVTGGTLQLAAAATTDAGVPTVQPAVWASDEPTVATVDGQGVVTAVAPGRAGVSATVGGVGSTAATVRVYPPPGGVVAYSAADGDGGRRQVHLLTISLDGGTDQVLAEGWAPSLSPDTNLVAYQRGGTSPAYPGYPNRYDSLYTLDRTVGSERLLLSNPSSYVNLTGWSLDGTRVVYDFDLGLGAVKPDGTGAAYFYAVNGYDDGPDVNPADGRVAFWNVLAGGGILTISSASTGRAVVPGTVPGDGFPRWSPDGGVLSFARYEPDAGQYAVYTVRPDGTGWRPLFPVLDTHTHGAIGLGAPPPAGAWTAEGAWAVMPAVVDDVPGLYAVSTDGAGCAMRIPAAGGATADYVSVVR